MCFRFSISLFFSVYEPLYLIMQVETAAIILQQLLAGVALLFVPISVYLQIRITKAFCPICVLICMVLLMQGVVLFSRGLSGIPSSYDIFEISVPLLVSLVVAVCFSYGLYVYYIRQVEGKEYKTQLLSLKRDPVLFNSLLHRSCCQRVDFKDDIVIGSGKCIISMIISPHCPYCKRLIADLDFIMDRCGGLLEFYIRLDGVEGDVNPRLNYRQIIILESCRECG